MGNNIVLFSLAGWLLVAGLYCGIAEGGPSFGGLFEFFKAANRDEIIDSTGNNEPIENIEIVAEALCGLAGSQKNDNSNSNSKATVKQISRVSTIDRLQELFEIAADKYGKCAREHQAALGELNAVLKLRLDNVCSAEKLAAIEKFHRDYLSTTKPDLARRAGRAELHPMLKLFFIYYAMELSSTCKRTVIHALEWDIGQFGFTADEYKLGEDNNLAHLLSGISDYLGPLDNVNDFDDVVFVWDLLEGGIIGEALRSSLMVEADYSDSATGRPLKLLIKVKNGREARRIQAKCLNRFKPIYDKVIMPVVRLSNLGYTLNDRRSNNNNNNKNIDHERRELMSNELIRRWYSIIQVCEAIEPIKFYEDPTLGPRDAVIMTKAEAEQLDSAEQPQTTVDDGDDAAAKITNYEPATNNWSQMDRIYAVGRIESKDLMRRVKLNTSARDRAMGRVFGRLVRHSVDMFKSRLIKKVGGVFVFRKPAANSAAIECDLNEEIQKSMNSLNVEELVNADRHFEPTFESNGEKPSLKAAGGRGSSSNSKASNCPEILKEGAQDYGREEVLVGRGVLATIANACAGLSAD